MSSIPDCICNKGFYYNFEENEYFCFNCNMFCIGCVESSKNCLECDSSINRI